MCYYYLCSQPARTDLRQCQKADPALYSLGQPTGVPGLCAADHGGGGLQNYHAARKIYRLARARGQSGKDYGMAADEGAQG